VRGAVLLALAGCSSASSPAAPGSLADVGGCCVIASVRYGDDCLYYPGDDPQHPGVWVCCEVDPPVIPDTVELEWRCTVVRPQ
jgi:hypothetical protein